MKRQYLFIGFIMLAVLLLNANAQAGNDDILERFFSDHRTEIEKISGDPQLMQKYVLSQKDVNVRYKDGKALLHYASVKNYRDIVKLLLEKGADINAADKDGRTPLHEAMSYSSFEVVGLLIEQGANINQENKDGETPLRSVVYWDYKKKAIEVVNLFIEKGFDLTKESHADLLNDAIGRERREIAVIFLKNGIGFNDTALIKAAQKGYDDVFNILIEKGADPKQTVAFKDVCKSGNMNIVRALAARGVKPAAEDIDICLYNGHKEAAVHLSGMLKADKARQVDLKKRCAIKPYGGHCKAMFVKAYFDAKAKVCMEFVCGGCSCVVPFDSLEACKKVCEE